MTKTRFIDTDADAPTFDDADFWERVIKSHTTAAVRVVRHPKQVIHSYTPPEPPPPPVEMTEEQLKAKREEYKKAIGAWRAMCPGLMK